MPVINIKMTHEDGGATKEQKEELSKGITELFAKIFNGRGANSAVVIIEERISKLIKLNLSVCPI